MRRTLQGVFLMICNRASARESGTVPSLVCNIFYDDGYINKNGNHR